MHLVWKSIILIVKSLLATNVHCASMVKTKKVSGSELMEVVLLWGWICSPWRGGNILRLTRQTSHVLRLQAHPLLISEKKRDWRILTWVPSSPESHLAAVTVGFQRLRVGGNRSSWLVAFIYIYSKYLTQNNIKPSFSLDLEAGCLHSWHTETDRFYGSHC